jgi:hypothetical protein
MMEAARTSETLVNFYQTTRCYNPEDSNLQGVTTQNTTIDVFSAVRTTNFYNSILSRVNLTHRPE